MSATSIVRLDMTGLSCPLPLLGAKKMLDDLPNGQHLVLISDCPGTGDDLRAWATQSGHEIIGAEALNGRRIAYTLTTSDTEANRNSSDIWVIAVDGTQNRQLTDHPSHDRHPVWSPDGRTIAFESSRSGTGQIWLVSGDGGPARQFLPAAIVPCVLSMPR